MFDFGSKLPTSNAVQLIEEDRVQQLQQLIHKRIFRAQTQIDANQNTALMLAASKGKVKSSVTWPYQAPQQMLPKRNRPILVQNKNP